MTLLRLTYLTEHLKEKMPRLQCYHIKTQIELISLSKKEKFHNLRAHQFQSTQLVDEEVTLPGIDKEPGEETSGNECLIFLNESLKPSNRRLLEEAKKASRKHNYKYKGYTVNG